MPPNHKILYLYDANGRKLKKQVIHNAQSHHTDYSGAFQYEDGFLTLILTPEGRIVKHSSTYDPQYFLKDYLGNVRVVYHANPETGMVEVVQEDHYDPFGMKLGGLGYVSDIENKYLFQGKEFNDEAIDTDNDGNTDTYMNWYDFEARQFDPQIARWHVADPVAQYPSPYAGMGNNPVSLVDPNGMATMWSLEDETTLWYTMAIDSRIHSRHIPYNNNSEPLHTAYTEELISRRGAIEISGGGASGDWKAEKLALFYYTQELRRWKAEMDKISAYLNEPGPKESEAMDELAMMIQNASKTGLSFGGPGCKSQYLRNLTIRAFGNVPDLGNVYGNGELPAGYTLSDGRYYNPEGEPIWGVSINNDIYISPAAQQKGPEFMFSVIGHELVHVLHFNAGLDVKSVVGRSQTEHAAWVFTQKFAETMGWNSIATMAHNTYTINPCYNPVFVDPRYNISFISFHH